ncbi:hypothetical protein JCM3765_003123 [Sporobolomyces pararoseus]
MSFFFKFLTGAVIGGTATIYYRQEIQTTTTRLSQDLNNLSRQLVQTREIPHQPIKTSNGNGNGNGVAMIPKRLPLTEEIKSRWNEQLFNGYESIRTTDWSRVVSKSYQNLKSLTGKLQQQQEAKQELSSSSPIVSGNEGLVKTNERMVDRIDGKL